MFKSHEEFWRTANWLIAELEASGNSTAADELKNEMHAVTGLTDNWDDFLEAIENVKKQYSPQLNSTQRSTLKNIHREVYQRTYCTSTGPGWRIQARISRIQGAIYKRQRRQQ